MNCIDEGTIAKMIMSVERVCKNVKLAAQMMGDAEIAEKMDEAVKLIHRDIIFAPSLYLQWGDLIEIKFNLIRKNLWKTRVSIPVPPAC